MRNVLLVILLAALAACATVDMDRRVRDAGDGRQGGAVIVAPIEAEPLVIERERPVYVPVQPPQAPASPQPAPGQPTVRESNRAGILEPSEFSHAAVVYDFDGDWVYEVYTQPLRVTDISLEPGERVSETPFVSDSDRWVLGAGVSYANGVPVQHVYVKPTEASISASLVVNTDRRVYHVILRSYRDIHMPMVRWRYPAPAMPGSFVRPPDANDDGQAPSVDPRSLSFGYRITYGLFSRPSWLPELVYDDGQKTYISFPESVLRRELPAVFENRRDVLNYRVAGRLIIIDKLVGQITVKIDRTEITITKKRGQP